MKKIIGVLIITTSMFGCAPATTTKSTTNNTIASNANLSPEAEAKNITDKMKSVLVLNTEQEDKIMVLNLVNVKLTKKLKESNETAKLNSTKTKYQSEIKEVLSEEQYAKFLTEF